MPQPLLIRRSLLVSSLLATAHADGLPTPTSANIVGGAHASAGLTLAVETRDHFDAWARFLRANPTAVSTPGHRYLTATAHHGGLDVALHHVDEEPLPDVPAKPAVQAGLSPAPVRRRPTCVSLSCEEPAHYQSHAPEFGGFRLWGGVKYLVWCTTHAPAGAWVLDLNGKG